ncbi:hypothetical protein [Sphingomonas zeae]
MIAAIMARSIRALVLPRRTSLTDFSGKPLARSKAAKLPYLRQISAFTPCLSVNVSAT